MKFMTILWLLCFFAFQTIAQVVEFSDQQIIVDKSSDVEYLRNIYPIDLDGDGDIDVLCASTADDKIAWYENIDGNGRFSEQKIIDSNADGAADVYAADADNDGDMDIFAPLNNGIVWYENLDGSENFEKHFVSTSANDMDCVFVIDIDGDDGSENFEKHFVSTSANDMDCVFVIDIDGDGDNDVLSDKGTWYENVDRKGSFKNEHFIFSFIGKSIVSVFAADIDGDSDMDVLTASRGDTIAWYENYNGNGTFGEQKIITTLSDRAESVYAADIDGDGDIDVLSAYTEDNKIAWYENTDGKGAFGDQQVITNIARTACDVYTTDIDGDGDIDVLSASSKDNKIAWYENMDGKGSFSSPKIITTDADGASCVSAADINDDGNIDVLSASYQDSKIAWYENTDGRGAFGEQQIINKRYAGFRSVYMADIDGDDDMDALSASVFDDKIAWYENIDGHGTFGIQQNITTDADYAIDTFPADIDGDGDIDVLSASYQDSKIAWYENTDGRGTFGIQQIITTTAMGARCVHAVDIDGDGDIDVLSASTSEDKIAWYENMDGSGVFGDQKIITTDVDDPVAIYTADLDGDNDIDVLSASDKDSKFSWYENTDANGMFGNQIVIDKSFSPIDIKAADIDNDGDLDVISAAYNFNAGYIVGTLYWYENTDGYGLFDKEHRIHLDFEAGVIGIDVADLDCDGDLDIISIIHCYNRELGFSYRLVWYENTDGHGTFPYEQVIKNNTGNVQHVCAADLDRDGDMDILAANDSIISWYENLYIITDIKTRDVILPPQKHELSQNYPNPFNSQTKISFSINQGGIVKLTIYNITGQLIKQLVNEHKVPGVFKTVWDGTDNYNRTVSSGIYFYTLTLDDQILETKKLTLLK